MDDVLAIDLIMNRKKYPIIYNASIICLVILLVTSYIIFVYKYQSYYITKGKITDNKLELLVSSSNLKYINQNNTLKIDNKYYSYKIVSIDDEIYLDNNYNDYQYVYLLVQGLVNIDNYVYEIQIPKENKIIAKYLKEYL